MTAASESNTLPAAPAPQPDINADLGFGSVVARESRRRLLNRDGTFNVRREGLPLAQSLNFYHYVLTISWPRFLSYLIGIYLVTNVLFAVGYMGCGEDALTGFTIENIPHRFATAFFFSVQTLATIGYGGISPGNIAANLLVTVESLAGLLAFSLIAGIVFARFSRPVAQILFSKNAVIAPYRGGTAFMFRIVNQRSSQIVELEGKVLISRRKKDGLASDREFLQLDLERDRVTFFPLSWTIVHPIDTKSPLYGKTQADIAEAEGEFLVLLNGFDETFSQTVHTRSSYRADEVVWGARFTSILNIPKDDGVISVDVRKLHDFERAQV
jgi:inward rectifier potassium channel